MSVLSAAISWSAVMGLVYLAGYCILAAIVGPDPVYAAFGIAFGASALWITANLVREGGRS